MIIVKLSGGLGNQLFQFATGLAVANYKAKTLKLDLGYFDSVSEFQYSLDRFGVTTCLANQEEIEVLKGGDSFFQKVLRKLGLIKRQKYFPEKERNIFDSSIFEKDDAYLDGYWQNERYFKGIESQLKKMLKLDFSSQFQGQAFYNEILETESVAIHVRRGDYLQNPHIGVLPKSYYDSAVAKIEGLYANARFYVFSNDIEWCKKNITSILPMTYVTVDGDDLDEFNLMKHCKHIITANSSFSWWAAWLNENKNKTVICPKRWVNVNNPNYNWAADNWDAI